VPEVRSYQSCLTTDLYHHYTVDEHTLKAVEALDLLYASHDKTARAFGAPFSMRLKIRACFTCPPLA